MSILKQLPNNSNQVNPSFIVEAIPIDPDVWKIRMSNGQTYLVDDDFMNGIGDTP